MKFHHANTERLVETEEVHTFSAFGLLLNTLMKTLLFEEISRMPFPKTDYAGSDTSLTSRFVLQIHCLVHLSPSHSRDYG